MNKYQLPAYERMFIYDPLRTRPDKNIHLDCYARYLGYRRCSNSVIGKYGDTSTFDKTKRDKAVSLVNNDIFMILYEHLFTLYDVNPGDTEACINFIAEYLMTETVKQRVEREALLQKEVTVETWDFIIRHVFISTCSNFDPVLFAAELTYYSQYALECLGYKINYYIASIETNREKIIRHWRKRYSRCAMLVAAHFSIRPRTIAIISNTGEIVESEAGTEYTLSMQRFNTSTSVLQLRAVAVCSIASVEPMVAYNR